MMFTEARERMKRPRPKYSGAEYDHTSVGQDLALATILGQPGDSFDVKYRELLKGGHVQVISSIAGLDWLKSMAKSPGIEMLSVLPSKVTFARWTSVGRI
ncbi:hypothetical protein [Aeromonas phage SW69-9]|uniref:Uncharacterized protein n=1 Tax=Aeromonas phage vB_AehM_DM2 TaxID=2973716 RepID=A0AA94YP59_9CAUD|nr:hypothetical protein [Aeromonas phage SW69-9]UYD59622.1 hypothetical protein JNMOADIG_00093 [Aeromonas phage avDM5]UYD60404.1 hypothetical protein NPHMPGLK_00069 [Aeromonas phage avDM2]UYD60760.1 hypothetical protein NHNEHLNL_00164 [Aeromonas phage avDM2]